MLRTLFSVGRFFGVDVRLHISFPILLLLSLVWGYAATGNPVRGFGLWAALMAAVIVRDVARALAAIYSGLDLRGIFIFPVGGVMAFAPLPDSQPTASTRGMIAAGPVANLFAGGMLLGSCYALIPGIHLIAPPLISPSFVLRSFVTTQLFIAAFGLLPSALTARMLPERKRDEAAAESSPGRFRFRFNFGAILALMSIIAGILTANIWFVGLGGFFLAVSQSNTAGARTIAPAQAASIRVRDVMLTDFALLSASDTLSGAVGQSMRSMQDVFPVVRGDLLVGAVSRATLLNSLSTGGDSYLQGSMTRALHVAAPDDTLADAQRRASAANTLDFIPVVENDALLGILTPDSVGRAVSMMPPRAVRRETDHE